MLSNVPQFIDIEDKIVGPLPAKQLGWLALGGVILLVLWSIMSIGAFIAAAVFVAILFVGLAFYRPYNQTLLSFILSSVGFLFKPKMYIWKRLPDKEIRKEIVKEEAPVIIEKKNINEEKLQEISKLLDTK